jgi:hypothetical protein
MTSGNGAIAYTIYNSDSVTISGFSDTAGSTWTALSTNTYTGSGRLVAYYTCNIAATGTNTLTITFSGNITGAAITVEQFSGQATSSCLDTSVMTAQATNQSPKSGSVTTATADTILIAGIGDFCTSVTVTPATNYTERNETVGAYIHMQVQDRIVSSTGSYEASDGTTSGWCQWVGGQAAFKIASGGGGGSTARSLMLLGVGP